MNDDRRQPDSATGPGGDVDRDVLITRAVDGRATGADWVAMESLAAREQGFWRDLALAQRDQRALERLVGVATNVASTVDLPTRVSDATHRDDVVISHHASDLGHDQRSRLRIWGGWVAAAILGVAILSGRLNAPLPGEGGGRSNKAELLPASLSSEQVLEDALKRGRKDGMVFGEYGDPYVLATEPAADGQGYTVVYIRPILVKRQVQNVYQGQRVIDETGQLVGVRPQPMPARVVGY